MNDRFKLFVASSLISTGVTTMFFYNTTAGVTLFLLGMAMVLLFYKTAKEWVAWIKTKSI